MSHWDQGSFGNFLHPSLKLHTHPFMVERHGLLAFTLPVMVESKQHEMYTLPFMVERKQHEMYTLPFMVERKQHKIYTHPFVVERHSRDALPFMVEETGQVVYSNIRVDNMYKHTSEVSSLYWNAQSLWSETLNLKNAGFSTCLEICPELCKSDYTFSEYVDLKIHKLWLYLRSSPMLELYVRAFLTLLRLFDIISQRDLPSVKCQELHLRLKRNVLRSHDFAALMKRIGGCSTILNFANYIVYLIIFHHVSAFQYFKFSIKTTKRLCIMILALTVVFFLELDLPGFKPTQSFNPHNDLVTKNEILGGGPAGIFSAEKLSEFAINEVNAGGIYRYSNYVPESDDHTLQSIKSPTLLCKMPLTELISHLSIPNLKFIAQCHNITLHSKSKSLEIQSIIESHKCKSCEEYVEIFEIGRAHV